MLALLAAPAPVRAQVLVYESFTSGQLFPNNGTESDVNANQYLADTFTFAAPTTFNTIEWFGFYGPSFTPGVDNFTISFHATDGTGLPLSAPLAGLSFSVGNNVNRTLTTVSGGVSSFRYSRALAPDITLAAGTYGVSIVNDTTLDADDNWFWNRATPNTANGQDIFFRTTPAGSFQRFTGANLTFRLINNAAVVVAPEPGSFALLGVGLAGMGAVAAVRRRRPRNAKPPASP